MQFSNPSPAALTIVDTEVFNAASPGTAVFTDLALSSIVGANFALVLLKVFLATPAGAQSFSVRQNGDTEIDYFGGEGIGALYKTGSDKSWYVLCPTDAAGIIEWYYSKLNDTVVIDLIAYIR